MGRIGRKKIHQPELFQGNLKKKAYFEGWYFKQVASEPDLTISFIPGISLNKADKHAFIQVIISPPMETYYFKFDINTFNSNESEFNVTIGSNTFSNKAINIALSGNGHNISGELQFSPFQFIQDSFWMPNIMGPFGYLPFMECNHGVISMSHHVSGVLKINDKTLVFNNTKGYLEKDWGKSFPKTYSWVQCNHFDQEDVSFMFSKADVPFLGMSFQGFICNLVHQGHEYRFASYTGAKILKIQATQNKLNIVIKSRKYQLTIQAESEAYGELIAPNTGIMQHIIKEGIEGKVKLCLTTHHGECLLQTQGNHAGIEIEQARG